MPSKKNPYEPLSKEEIAKREKDKKALEKKIKDIAELGAKCLAHEDFQKYRAELQVTKDEIIRLMIKNVDPDPIKDAFFLRACLNKLDALFMIEDMIQKDTRRANAGK